MLKFCAKRQHGCKNNRSRCSFLASTKVRTGGADDTNGDKKGCKSDAHEPESQEGTDDALTSIRQTGRLFIRNLPFCSSDEDIADILRPFGPVSEARVVCDKHSLKSKGFAVVTFELPLDAVSAFEALDGQIFQGRILHVLPGHKRQEENADTAGQAKGGSCFKSVRDAQRKAEAGNKAAWSTLYMRDDTIAEAIAAILGIPKSELLDPEAPDAAVRLALGEAQVLARVQILQRLRYLYLAFSRHFDHAVAASLSCRLAHLLDIHAARQTVKITFDVCRFLLQ
jgi:hypothetical protein